MHLVDEKEVKVKTVESLHCVLYPAFDMAVRDEIIRKNPNDGVISEIKKRQGRKQKLNFQFVGNRNFSSPQIIIKKEYRPF